jgi:hypothetical protein
MSSSNPTQPTRHGAPAASTHGSRPIATFDAQRSNAFQRELDRLNRNDRNDNAAQSQGNPSTGKQRPEDQQNAGGEHQFADDRDQRDDIQASLSANGFSLARSGKIAAMSQAAPELPPEHLNRIAAAIQELVVQGGNAKYHLQLPAGSATINGAVLGQDAGGRLTIQLIANAVLPPAAIQQLQQRLFERLKNRNLRLGLISERNGKVEVGQKSRTP